jgi:predicted ATP-grasp superfamily ATP-dependent carboligase
MRILVYEHITGGGLMHEVLPESLACEGDLMLRALVNDLMDIPGTEVMVTRDSRLAPMAAPALTLRPNGRETAWQLLHRACSEVDAVWPIAPETGGVLEHVSRTVLACGRTLLGSRPQAISIAASKLASFHCLTAAGVKTVFTCTAPTDLPDADEFIVVKPDDGAGCMNTRLLHRDALPEWWTRHSHAGYVLQPYMPGDAQSLSLLCRDGRGQLLTCNRQKIAIEAGAFSFSGVKVNEVRARLTPYAELVGQVAAAMPGLWGYVGIDVICGSSGPAVVDVNPRLTTSYAGLRRALHCNPALLVLGLLQSELDAQLPSVAAKAVNVEVAHA